MLRLQGVHKAQLWAAVMVLGVGVSGFAVATAQDTADTSPAAQQVRENSAKAEQRQQARDAVAARRAKRKRWYLGATTPRPLGRNAPALGTPMRILPQPFVPVDSLSDPDSAPLLPISDSADTPNEGAELVDSDTRRARDLGTSGSNDLGFGVIEETSLARLDPSIAPLAVHTENQPDTAALWQGYSREAATDRLGMLTKGRAGGRHSLVYRQSLKQLARGGFDIPARGGDDQAIAQLMRARLDLLASIGDWAGYMATLNNLDPSRSWPGFNRLLVERGFLLGNSADACFQARSERDNSKDIYWVRIGALCSALDGDRAAVDFQYGIIEESARLDAGFYELIDMILLEAEAANAGTPELARPSGERDMKAPLVVSGLHSAMARLAGVNITSIDMTNSEPLAVASLMTLPGLSDDARADLTISVAKSGLIDPAALASFFRAYKPTQTPAATDNIALAKYGAIAASRQNADTPLAGWQNRVGAAAQLWQQSINAGWAPILAPVLIDILGDIPAHIGLGADLGWLMRASLLAGDQAQAKSYFNSLRSLTAGENADADEALKAAIPAAVMGGLLSLDYLTQSRFDELLSNRRNPDASNGFLVAASYLSTLDALRLEAGPSDIIDARWQQVAELPLIQQGSSINPAAWRSFLAAGRKADVPSLLVDLEYLLFGQQLEAPAPALTGSVLATLMAHGLDDMAIEMALERLILAGL